jgi:tRNA dimethylallyltransferase
MQLADRLPIEIVSVDSGQVYRGMDIGTAKPTPAERSRVAHHLIDLVEPNESYSAGRFRADAIAAIEDIRARGRVALLVGGTMLYYRALAQGLDDLPGADPAIRAALDAEAAARGWPAMHAALARVDAVTAARLGPHDAQRIQRALEVFRASGRPLSALQTARRAAPPFRLHAFALMPADRARLHARVAERFDRMLGDGLVDEVRALRAKFPLQAGSPAMRCVGYRQVFEHLEGSCGAAAMRERAIAATRQLARRQLTWLRGMREVEALDPTEPKLAERLVQRIAAG